MGRLHVQGLHYVDCDAVQYLHGALLDPAVGFADVEQPHDVGPEVGALFLILLSQHPSSAARRSDYLGRSSHPRSVGSSF